MILFIVILMKFINLLSITFLACCISFTEQFSFFFSYLIKQYFFFLRQLFCHYTCMTYIPSTQAFYSYFSTNYRGTQWICSSKYIFFGQIFARAGRLGKNAMSLEGTCCWEIVNSGCLRRFRKDVAM